MRKFWMVSALALATVAASPAFAQTVSRDQGIRQDNSGAVSRYAPRYHRHMANEHRGYGAYASEPAPRFAPSYGPAGSSGGARCTLSPSDINFRGCTGGL